MSEWRTSPSFPDYEVSEDGRVRRRSQSRTRSAGSMLKGKLAYGYWRYALRHEGRPYNRGAHMLVCEAWHGPRPSPDHIPAHWDGDRLNNHFANLRWATETENAADRERHGATARGERHGRAVLTASVVRLIRERCAAGVSRKQIAEAAGVSRAAVYGVLSGRTWSHVQ